MELHSTIIESGYRVKTPMVCDCVSYYKYLFLSLLYLFLFYVDIFKHFT